jgi:hypothetical protein
MTSLWTGLTSWLSSEEPQAEIQSETSLVTVESPLIDFSQPVFDLKTLVSQLTPTYVCNSNLGTNNCSWSDLNLLMKLPRDHYVVNRRTEIIKPEHIMVLGDRYFYQVKLLRCDDLIGKFEVQLGHRVPQTTVDIVRSFEGRSPIVGLYLTNGKILVPMQVHRQSDWIPVAAICYQTTSLLIELTEEYIKNNQYAEDYIKFSFDAATFNYEHRKPILCAQQYLFSNKDYLIRGGLLGHTSQSNQFSKTVTYHLINRQTPIKFSIPRHWDLVTGLTIRQVIGHPCPCQLIISGHSTGESTISSEHPLPLGQLQFSDVIIDIPAQDHQIDLEICLEGRDLNTDEVPPQNYKGFPINEGIFLADQVDSEIN